MSKHYIYKLYIGNEMKNYCFYIGKSNYPKRRLRQHIKDCYNKSGKAYHRKLYKCIRSFTGYNKSKFDDYVRMKTITFTTKDKIDNLEKLLVNRNNSYCMNSIL